MNDYLVTFLDGREQAVTVKADSFNMMQGINGTNGASFFMDGDDLQRRQGFGRMPEQVAFFSGVKSVVRVEA